MRRLIKFCNKSTYLLFIISAILSNELNATIKVENTIDKPTRVRYTTGLTVTLQYKDEDGSWKNAYVSSGDLKQGKELTFEPEVKRATYNQLVIGFNHNARKDPLLDKYFPDLENRTRVYENVKDGMSFKVSAKSLGAKKGYELVITPQD